MSEARLATAIEVSALIRRAEGEGGFGTVLAKGDSARGSLLVIVAARGEAAFRLERLLQRDGSYAWEAIPAGDSASLQQHVARARMRDPDCWVLELDIPSPERFIAEMISCA